MVFKACVIDSCAVLTALDSQIQPLIKPQKSAIVDFDFSLGDKTFPLALTIMQTELTRFWLAFSHVTCL